MSASSARVLFETPRLTLSSASRLLSSALMSLAASFDTALTMIDKTEVGHEDKSSPFLGGTSEFAVLHRGVGKPQHKHAHMTGNYLKSLFGNPGRGKFVAAVLCCSVAVFSWSFGAGVSVLGGLFCIPAIIFGHLAWTETKRSSQETRIRRPWLIGILALGYLRLISGVFSFLHGLIYSVRGSLRHEYPESAEMIEYGLLGVFVLLTMGREAICWFTKTNKAVEKIEEQMRELKEIKSQIDRQIEESKTQGKVLEGVGSDIKRLNVIVQKITDLNPAANSADSSSG